MLLLRALALTTSCAFAAVGCAHCDWVRWVPEGVAAGEWQEIAQSDIFEVVASREYVAVNRDLAMTAVAPLTVEAAKYFNPRYETAPGKQAYLVRAVYGHGGTGGYSVLRHESDLRIVHDSLGHSDACNASALIINLDFAPREVYLEVSIDE